MTAKMKKCAGEPPGHVPPLVSPLLSTSLLCACSAVSAKVHWHIRY